MTRCLSFPLFLLFTLPLGARAQEIVVHDSATAPDLSGRWHYSESLRSFASPIKFEQNGTSLEAVVEERIKCLSNEYVLHMTFAGEIRGTTVTLHATEGRLDGGGSLFGHGCSQAQW